MILNKGSVALGRIGSEAVGDAGIVKKQIKNCRICGQNRTQSKQTNEKPE
jgi:hypothetical protein